ncbi:MAG: pyruvate ferredoxin oxidoreductase [bacterium]|nr:pyruvate ferredoxin oxidoreductase [bacterium]
MPENSVVNVVIAGLGGQGVVKASEILSDTVFRAGHDVKKSEVHGMSQRGGSVTSDVRFGPEVFSPMVPPARADFLVVLEASEIEVTRGRMNPDGRLFAATEMYDEDTLDDMKRQRTLNVAMLGTLSAHLDIDDAIWFEAIRANLPAGTHETNIAVFQEAKAAEQSRGQ